MEIYSMLNYNTIFFAECQDGNGFLFYFIVLFNNPAISIDSRLAMRHCQYQLTDKSWVSRLTRLTSGPTPDWDTGVSPVVLI